MAESAGYIEPEKVLGFEYEPHTHRYTERDVSLYALGIGAAQDALDRQELRFVYEQHKDGHKTLPTFGVLFPMFGLGRGQVPGLEYRVENGLHGEEYLELYRPLPTTATITCNGKITGVYDKGSGAVLITEATTFDENGDELAKHESTVFIRGIGGFGGDRGPSGKVNFPPDREPDKVYSEKIADNQPLLYRLSGDRTSLHIDPDVARAGGFDRPILHGLCTYGFASRAVLKTYAENDPDRFKSMKVRFAKPVYPGETLITEMWKETDTDIIFRCKVMERDAEVLTNARFRLR